MTSAITLLVRLSPNELAALQQDAALASCHVSALLHDAALELARELESSPDPSAPLRLWALPQEPRTEVIAVSFTQTEGDVLQLAAMACHFVLPGETLGEVNAAAFIAEAALQRLGALSPPAVPQGRASRVS